MKLKYRLIILLISIIIISTVPISLYIFDYEEDERISSLTSQALTNTRILSRSVVDILLINGGEISASQVDAKETISILKPLEDIGLIYADTVLLSNNQKYNGVILAQLFNKEIEGKNLYGTERVSENEIEHLKKSSGFQEIYAPKLKETCYEFISISNIPNTTTRCVGRLVFSKSFIVAPINDLKLVVLFASLISIFVAIALGIFFSRFFSKPIENLINEVEIYGSGDFDHEINMPRTDEIGKLATTFNHLAKIVKLEIETLIEKNIELTRYDKLKDEFLANITHELKTPLHGIIGLAESLINGIAGKINEDTRYNLSLMIKSGKRLGTLVNDILDYSQLQHDKIAIEKISIDLFSVFKVIQLITEPLIGNKDLEIDIDIEPNKFFVFADENRLQQILLNIVGNSIKFSEKGKVTLSANDAEESKDEIVVSISDTGIGIPEESRDLIFQSFQQGSDSISRQHGGTGLGLAITKKLVELHDGKIWFTSKANEGSSFYFTLIKATSDKAKKEIKRETLPPDFIKPEVVASKKYDSIMRDENEFAEKYTIMIVDDEPVNSQVLINHLVIEGYNVIPFEDGIRALEAIEKGDVPDLLILDIMLPQISGYEICRILREKFSSVELPILILTAKNRVTDIIQGFELGTNDYLTKPVNREELLARVQALLIIKKSVDESNKLIAINREIEIARRIQTSSA